MAAELNDAATATLADGGFFVALTDDEAPVFRRVAVASVASAATLAATALQPTDVGTAAYADASTFATVAQLGDIAAVLASILAGGD